MDDTVVHFLDRSMPLANLVNVPEGITDFKTEVVDAALRP
jgi:hypothetical protein